MTPVLVESGCVAALLAAAAIAIALGRFRAGSPVLYAATLAISLVAGGQAFLVLLAGGAVSDLLLPLGLPGVGARLRLDALSAFFLVVINLAGAAASLYALGYGRHEAAPSRVLPFFPAFLAGMNLVTLAADAFTFLLAWEFMSLSSWALVTAHHGDDRNIRAGYVYLLMASAGTLCLLLAFGLLGGGGLSFDAIRAGQPGGVVLVAAIILALIGTGSKAGLVPLHVWLPLAHPAAPSHVSALLSGAMTKVAVYGFIRIVFDLIHAPASWTAMVVVAAGGITAAIGMLYALMQSDLKRLLAYSTVENIGIIFAGLGLALAFQANGMDWAAALALTAALFHAFNHAVFKSLLFFGVGAVLTATGERSMDRLGGLIHRMPATAVFVLIGCAAIAALPPLNGFVSEWLTFQAILVSPQLPQWGLKFLIPAVGALLAFSAALTATCFVKAFGVTFLGRPRTPAAETANETDGFSLAAMGILSALCFIAGILPGLVIDLLAPVTQSLVGRSMPVQHALPWLSLVPVAERSSSYNGIILLAFLILAGALTAMVIHRVATRATRRVPMWDGGYPQTLPATQYAGSSFVQPIRRVFGSSVFILRETVDMPRPGDVRAGTFRIKMIDPAWRFAYGPIGRLVRIGAARLNRLQFLTIRAYLTLVFGALIVLLVMVAAWR